MKRVFTGALMLSISGCSWIGLTGEDGIFRDRGNDYLKAEVIEPTQIPAAIDANTLEDLYYIPPLNSNATALADEFEVPRPQNQIATNDESPVRIQKLGDRQWILIQATPSEVWPRLLYFLEQREQGVTNKEPAKGLIETGILASGGRAHQDVYRLHLEQGLQQDLTEIHLLHAWAQVQDGGQVSWPQRSISVAQETQMVEQVARFLAEQDYGASVSLLAQAIGGEPKSYIINDRDRVSAIGMSIDFQRAWAALALALDKSGFVIQDRDPAQGLYRVRYQGRFSDIPVERSLWQRLLGLEPDRDDLNAMPESTHIEYWVKLREHEGRVIAILEAIDETLEADLHKALVALVRNYLA